MVKMVHTPEAENAGTSAIAKLRDKVTAKSASEPQRRSACCTPQTKSCCGSKSAALRYY
jgi:hypothetical protein